MKKWVEKLIEQFDFDLSSGAGGVDPAAVNDDRATLLYMIDTFNKHLIEVEGHPVRKTRETLDEFAREILKPQGRAELERVFFRFRQFFSTYRVSETTYVHQTFEEFRNIIWEFVDQLSDDISQEQKDDFELRTSLDLLKEAVESNSIDGLKSQSRKFIDCYVEKQFRKEKRRSSQMKSIRKNLNTVKKQLGEAASNARLDHLTQAYNRKAFDEFAAQHLRLFSAGGQPVSLLFVDIDHFKRINDTYGHDIGDFCLKELVKTLKSIFTREPDVLARIGGEEFAVLLPDHQGDHAMKRAEDVLNRVRGEAYVHEGREIRFTVSVGAAQLCPGEDLAAWCKRADLALYNSKNTGRNKATLAPAPLTRVA